MKKILITLVFALFFISMVSAITSYNHSVPMLDPTSSGGSLDCEGEGIQTGGDVIYLYSVNKSDGTTATVLNVRNSTCGAILATATFSGDKAILASPLTLAANTKYVLNVNNSGASWTNYYKNGYSGGYPITPHPSLAKFNWTDSWSGGFNQSNLLIAIHSLETTESSSGIEVTLNFPSNAASISTQNLTFNATLTPTVLNLSNATFYVWNPDKTIFNRTVVTSTGASVNNTYLAINNLSIGTTYHWNVFGCGNISNTMYCAFAPSNYTLTITAFEHLANYSNLGVYETTYQTYQFNITTNPLVLSVTSNFYYNGTKYTSAVTPITTSTYSLTNKIDVPLLINGINKSFFWEIIASTSDSGTINTNTSVFTQQVNKTYLTHCNTTIANVTVNFTIYSMINPNPNISSSFYSTWQYWLGMGSQKINYSFENLSEAIDRFKFCIFPINQQYYADADFQFSSSGYLQNHHYYRNVSLNTNTTEQKLYLLNNTLGTITKLKVLDSLQKGLANYMIQIQLYDIGTGTYNLVAMAKTNYAGEDLAYLNWYDSFYRFVIIDNNNQVVKLVDPYKIQASPQTFYITSDSVFNQDKFLNLYYRLYFSNATNNFVLIFSDPSGKITSGCLRVVRMSMTNYTTLYDQCVASTSGTLSYNIGGNNGTYSAVFYSTGSWGVIDAITILRQISSTVYNALGNMDATALALITVGTASFLGLFSPVAFVFMLIIGFLVAMGLGFMSITYLTQWFLFACVGGYLIWKLKS